MALAEKHMNNSTDDFFGEMTRDYYIGWLIGNSTIKKNQDLAKRMDDK